MNDNTSRLVRTTLRLLLFGFTVSLLVLIFTVVTSSPFGIFWFFEVLLVVFVILRALQSGIFSRWREISSRILGNHSIETNDGKVTELLEKPIELAHFRYRLDDSDNSEEFDAFLDKPIFIVGASEKIQGMDFQEEGSLETPRQVVESAVFDLTQNIQNKYNGQVTVDAEVIRGSIGVNLVFLATAYGAIAQWKDVNDSILLLRTQLVDVFRQISHTYKNVTGSQVHVSSNVSVKPKPSISRSVSRPKDVGVDSANLRPEPISVTNTFSPPAKDSNIVLNVQMPPRRGQSSGCLLLLLSLLTIAILLSFGYCSLFDFNKSCYIAWYEGNKIVSQLLVETGNFLREIGLQLYP